MTSKSKAGTVSARHDGLVALTGLPTAAGCEQHVIAYIRKWCDARPEIEFESDEFGNLHLTLGAWQTDRPVILEAHMDHPAFVVLEASEDGRRIWAEFRGGVLEPYFSGSKVQVFAGNSKPEPGVSGLAGVAGRVVNYQPSGSQRTVKPTVEAFPVVEFAMTQACHASPGDLATWSVGRPVIRKGLLHAPACDDLAAVAATLDVLDRCRSDVSLRGYVGGVFTRAEEVGFVGAIALCKSGRLPRKASIYALENSRSFVESPIGGGPIIRVGDRTSTFDSELTRLAVAAAESLASEGEGFKFQRRLMPGGTCEATAFCEFGYRATCLCLPLGHYHNMDDSDPEKPRIAAEYISLRDYEQLVDLLERLVRGQQDSKAGPTLKKRLNGLLKERGKLLD